MTYEFGFVNLEVKKKDLPETADMPDYEFEDQKSEEVKIPCADKRLRMKENGGKKMSEVGRKKQKKMIALIHQKTGGQMIDFFVE